MDSLLESLLDAKGVRCLNALAGFQVSGECVKHLVSKALSYGIIAGAMFVKVPQISKIQKAKSTRGLSVSAFVTELIMYTATLSYFVNHPDAPALSTYGEYVFLVIQALILVLQVFAYDDQRVTPRGGAAGKVLFLGFYVPLAFAGLSGLIPFAYLQMMFNFSTAMLIYARVPQVVALFRAKSAGELSAITCLMTFAGSGARLGTLLAEGVADMSTLVGNSMAVLLNGIICAQIFAYGSGKKSEVVKKMSASKSTSARRTPAKKTN